MKSSHAAAGRLIRSLVQNEYGRPVQDAHFSQSRARLQAGSCARPLQADEAGPSLSRLLSLCISALLRHFPGLDQLVVVDGHSGRLLVRELALRSDVAVFLRLFVPVLGRFLLIEFWAELALHA